MSKYITKSKTSQMSQMQQEHKAPNSGLAAASEMTHDDISRRAYEIYAENGRKEGQSEQNWLQAQNDLKHREEWQEADEEVKAWQTPDVHIRSSGYQSL